MSNAKLIVGTTGGQINFSQTNNPETPPAGYVGVYAQNDQVYWIGSNGQSVITSGTSGTSGINGTSGSSGVSGTSGSSGSSGSSGVSGSSGTSGVDGAAGSSGTSGVSGSSGTSGVDGAAGSSGTSGVSGSSGTSGVDGAAGSSGTSGVSGSSGTSGVDGAAGSSGTSGVSGSSGTSGVDGAAGSSGTSGVSGSSGTSGVDGAAGSSGTSGVSGSSGTSGVDGAAGSSGTSGVNGATGPAGANGTSGVDGTSGTSGLDGATGPIGPTGPAGDPAPAGLVNGTGTDSLKVADNLLSEPATASGNYSIAFGLGATASGIDAIAIGKNAFSNANNSIVISNSGTVPEAPFCTNQIVIGNYRNDYSYDGTCSVMINPGDAGGWIQARSVAIGPGSNADGPDNIAIGSGTQSSGQRAVSIGYQNSSTWAEPDWIAIGTSSSVAGCNEISIGFRNNFDANPYENPSRFSVVVGADNCRYEYSTRSATIGFSNSICNGSDNSGVLGHCNVMTHSGSFIIGNSITTERANTVHTGSILSLGQAATKRHAIGSTGGTVTIDFENSNIQTLSLTSSITSLTKSNPIDGGVYTIFLTQAGTGSYTVDWGADVKWAGGTSPTLSTAIGATDAVTLIFDAGITGYYGNANLNFS